MKFYSTLIQSHKMNLHFLLKHFFREDYCFQVITEIIIEKLMVKNL